MGRITINCNLSYTADQKYDLKMLFVGSYRIEAEL